MRHLGLVSSARFSRDGTRVVTASEDNTARLWDADTGKPLGEALTHQGAVLSAQFSPDGKRVVTASGDQTARLWEITPAISDNRHLLPALAEAIAGNKEAIAGNQLSGLGALEPLENQIGQLNRLREQTENTPLGKPTAESFVRWVLLDPVDSHGLATLQADRSWIYSATN